MIKFSYEKLDYSKNCAHLQMLWDAVNSLDNKHYAIVLSNDEFCKLDTADKMCVREQAIVDGWWG